MLILNYYFKDFREKVSYFCFYRSIFKIMTQNENTTFPKILLGNVRYIEYKNDHVDRENKPLFIYIIEENKSCIVDAVDTFE